MTNQTAVTILKNLEQSLDDYCELNDEGKVAFRMAIAALELFGNFEQLPSAQPEQRWIPCSERLPEGGRVVLVTEKGGFIRHCEYANYCDFQEFQTVEEGLTVHDVIAWMPLPEPYKGMAEHSMRTRSGIG